MKTFKKLILFSTCIPFFGRFIKKAVILYRHFLQISADVSTMRAELNIISQRLESAELLQTLENLDLCDNLIKSAPIAFRKLNLQTAQLSQRIATVENKLNLPIEG